MELRREGIPPERLAHPTPQWVTLLNLLGMNVEYERCPGTDTRRTRTRTLGPRALLLGKEFRAKLRRKVADFDMMNEVRGMDF